MATNILTTGSSTTPSSDATLTTDTLVSLKGVVGDVYVAVECKDDGGAYNQVAELTQAKPSGVLPAGTYRFTRRAGSTCGVFSA